MVDSALPPDRPAAPPALAPLQLPEFTAEDHNRWRSSKRGCLGLGCVGGLVVLALVLWGGYVTLEQSVWVSFKRSRDALLAAMPYEIDATQQVRVRADLARFTDHLKHQADPFPTLGGFNQAVARAVADGRLSRRELVAIEELMAAALAPPAPTPPAGARP